MTSLTNNVLAFDHGSIMDVRNDLSAIIPISLNQSCTLKWNSSISSTATISGSPGEVVSVVAFGNDRDAKITSNGGTWYYTYYSSPENDSSGTLSLSLPNYPCLVDYRDATGISKGSGITLGSINVSAQTNQYIRKCVAAVLAVRIS